MDICKVPQIVKNEGCFCDRIQESDYIQGKTQSEQVEYVSNYVNSVECVISVMDPMYKILPEKERFIFLKQTIIEIASGIDEDKLLFESYNFNKKTMKRPVIQQGFQVMNSISSLYFLCEYYKKKIVLVHEIEKMYCELSCKSYNPLYLYYRGDKKWSERGIQEFDVTLYKKCDMFPDVMKYDIIVKELMYIYNLHLQAISKYKLPELQTLALENKLQIQTDHGKPKKKQDLYNEIQLVMLQ